MHCGTTVMENQRISQADVEGMVRLAQGAEREKIRLMGRPLYAPERRWLVRAVFRVQYGPAVGTSVANERADSTLLMIDMV